MLVATRVPLRRMSYPVTPTLSVAALQVRAALVAVVGPAVRPAGTVGGWVSPEESVLPKTCISQKE